MLLKKILLVLLLIITINFPAFAEDGPNQAFEMELAKDAPKTDEYGLAIDFTNQLLERLKEHKAKLAAGTISTFEFGKPPRDFYKYYAAAYLLCSITNGTCPEMLDTLLEIDVINSKINGKTSCIHMLYMWKAWLDNDMEKRHNHQTKITHVNVVSKFNKEERPKYHRCSKTVEDLIADSTITPQAFFKKRYVEPVTASDYLEKTMDFFQMVKDKNLDIYASVGM